MFLQNKPGYRPKNQTTNDESIIPNWLWIMLGFSLILFSTASGLGLAAQPAPTPSATLEATSPSFQPTTADPSKTAQSPEPATTTTPYAFHIMSGDGYFSIQEGRNISLTWHQYPVGADHYIFLVRKLNGDSFLTIGQDDNPEDGVSVEWEAPQNITGRLVGLAEFPDGSFEIAELSQYQYFGNSAPQDVCMMKSSNSSSANLYLDRTEESEVFADLAPGVYAQVIRITGDGWLLIDAQHANYHQEKRPNNMRGWVKSNQWIKLFGPCELQSE